MTKVRHNYSDPLTTARITSWKQLEVKRRQHRPDRSDRRGGGPKLKQSCTAVLLRMIRKQRIFAAASVFLVLVEIILLTFIWKLHTESAAKLHQLRKYRWRPPPYTAVEEYYDEIVVNNSAHFIFKQKNIHPVKSYDANQEPVIHESSDEQEQHANFIPQKNITNDQIFRDASKIDKGKTGSLNEQNHEDYPNTSFTGQKISENHYDNADYSKNVLSDTMAEIREDLIQADSTKSKILTKTKETVDSLPKLNIKKRCFHYKYAESRAYRKCCLPKFDIYYLKVHKTASTTIRNILQRQILKHNLSIPFLKVPHSYPDPDLVRYVLPMDDIVARYHQLKAEGQNLISIGPKYASNLTERNSPGDGKLYQVIDFHTVFNESAIEKVMGRGKKAYFATIRHPFTQLMSSMAMWNLAVQLKLRGRNPIAQFLSNPAVYDRKLRGSMYNPTAMWTGIKISYTKNYMAYEFGLNLKEQDNESYVIDFLDRVGRSFYTLINEDFTTSMVMLRHKLCWSMDDMLYLHLRKADYSMKHKKRSFVLINKHREWSKVDYALYDMFVTTQSNLVKHGGSRLREEVEDFEHVLEQVTDFCQETCEALKLGIGTLNLTHIVKHVSAQVLTVESDLERTSFNISGEDCLVMMMDEQVLRWVIYKNQHPVLCEQDFVKFLYGIGVVLRPFVWEINFCPKDPDAMIKYGIPIQALNYTESFLTCIVSKVPVTL